MLLILAGVAIRLTLGNNGIITRAQEAVIRNENASVYEQLQFKVADYQMDAIETGNKTGILERLKTDRYVNEDNTLNVETLMERSMQTGKGSMADGDIYVLEQREATASEVTSDTESTLDYYLIYYTEEKDDINLGLAFDYNSGTTSDANIFTYTTDGYITGIKDEYIYNVEENTEKLSFLNSIKVASQNPIKVAAVVAPQLRMLVESVGTILYIPEEINDTKIIGISDRAFSGIINLTGVVMHDNIKTIGEEAFFYCNKLNNVNVSKELTIVGDRAFKCCYRLEKFDIGNKVTEIGTECFNNTGIVDNVYIPISVTEIGDYAFSAVAHEGGTIDCEVTGKPEGWSENWNAFRYINDVKEYANVNWGVKR